MLALGHKKFTDARRDQDAKVQRLQLFYPKAFTYLQAEEASKRLAMLRRQEKAGIVAVKSAWGDFIAKLGPQAKSVMAELMQAGRLAEGELDESELRSLFSFNDEDAANVLVLFRDGNFNAGVGSKSGYLAGIMRRYRNESKSKAALTSASGEAIPAEDEISDKLVRLDTEEVFADEDVEINETADEVEKLTGCPLPEDTLLYAVPMCGPYSAFNNFKYKVKLTPGTQKKGKAAKQAIEVFLKNRDLTQVERVHLKSLGDPEMVAIMVGDVKLSTPGLQGLQRAKKEQKKGQASR